MIRMDAARVEGRNLAKELDFVCRAWGPGRTLQPHGSLGI